MKEVLEIIYVVATVSQVRFKYFVFLTSARVKEAAKNVVNLEAVPIPFTKSQTMLSCMNRSTTLVFVEAKNTI